MTSRLIYSDCDNVYMSTTTTPQLNGPYSLNALTEMVASEAVAQSLSHQGEEVCLKGTARMTTSVRGSLNVDVDTILFDLLGQTEQKSEMTEISHQQEAQDEAMKQIILSQGRTVSRLINFFELAKYAIPRSYREGYLVQPLLDLKADFLEAVADSNCKSHKPFLVVMLTIQAVVLLGQCAWQVVKSAVTKMICDTIAQMFRFW